MGLDIKAVREELALALGVIDGLRVASYTPDRINVPQAIVGYPESMNYDSTFGRGSDRATWEVFVFVSRSDARGSSNNLAPYLTADGPFSVKHAIESHQPQAHYSSVRVQSVEVDGYVWADNTYLGARFVVDVIG